MAMLNGVLLVHSKDPLHEDGELLDCARPAAHGRTGLPDVEEALGALCTPAYVDYAPRARVVLQTFGWASPAFVR